VTARACCLGAYFLEGLDSFEFTSMLPAERVARTVTLGSIVHPQYENEFENGIAVSWDRVPFTLGCASIWSEKARAEHYNDLCQINGRIVLAGEHASYLPSWQEGAALTGVASSIDKPQLSSSASAASAVLSHLATSASSSAARFSMRS
jgi:monoamine oxidase